MKFLYVITCLGSLIACSGTYKNSYESAAGSSDTSIHTLANIGNCYAYKIKKDTVIGLLLAGISVQEDTTYYYFLLSGKIFNAIPSIYEFRSAGLSGLSVPSGYPSNAETTFCSYSLKEKDLKQFIGELILIDKIRNLSNKNIFGSSTSMPVAAELPAEYGKFLANNVESEAQMKRLHLQTSLYQVAEWKSLLTTDDVNELAKPEKIWTLSPKNAHPIAVRLMKESWLWSPADDLSPFGNDHGSDAFYFFKDWRKSNQTMEPALFLDVLEEKWGMSFSHKNITSEPELEIIEKTQPFYRDLDMAIIGVAFGQVVLEGKISIDLKQYAIKAIDRTMLPIGTKGMEEQQKTEFLRRLIIMRSILNQL